MAVELVVGCQVLGIPSAAAVALAVGLCREPGPAGRLSDELLDRLPGGGQVTITDREILPVADAAWEAARRVGYQDGEAAISTSLIGLIDWLWLARPAGRAGLWPRHVARLATGAGVVELPIGVAVRIVASLAGASRDCQDLACKLYASLDWGTTVELDLADKLALLAHLGQPQPATSLVHELVVRQLRTLTSSSLDLG